MKHECIKYYTWTFFFLTKIYKWEKERNMCTHIHVVCIYSWFWYKKCVFIISTFLNKPDYNLFGYISIIYYKVIVYFFYLNDWANCHINKSRIFLLIYGVREILVSNLNDKYITNRAHHFWTVKNKISSG